MQLAERKSAKRSCSRPKVRLRSPHEGAVPVSRTLPAMEFHLLTCKNDASEIHCGQAVNGYVEKSYSLQQLNGGIEWMMW